MAGKGHSYLQKQQEDKESSMDNGQMRKLPRFFRALVNSGGLGEKLLE